jgi:hypothetical protein
MGESAIPIAGSYASFPLSAPAIGLDLIPTKCIIPVVSKIGSRSFELNRQNTYPGNRHFSRFFNRSNQRVLTGQSRHELRVSTLLKKQGHRLLKIQLHADGEPGVPSGLNRVPPSCGYKSFI